MAAPVVPFRVTAVQAFRSSAPGHRGDLVSIGVVSYFEYTEYLRHVRHSPLSCEGRGIRWMSKLGEWLLLYMASVSVMVIF